ncbi:hypothetical protein BH10PSE19_BH10PSE19_13020 [soil metagenome]
MRATFNSDSTTQMFQMLQVTPHTHQLNMDDAVSAHDFAANTTEYEVPDDDNDDNEALNAHDFAAVTSGYEVTDNDDDEDNDNESLNAHDFAATSGYGIPDNNDPGNAHNIAANPAHDEEVKTPPASPTFRF